MRRRLRLSRDRVPCASEWQSPDPSERRERTADLPRKELRPGQLGLARVPDQVIEAERFCAGRGVTLRDGKRAGVLVGIVRLDEGWIARFVAGSNGFFLVCSRGRSGPLSSMSGESLELTVVVDNIATVWGEPGQSSCSMTGTGAVNSLWMNVAPMTLKVFRALTIVTARLFKFPLNLPSSINRSFSSWTQVNLLIMGFRRKK